MLDVKFIVANAERVRENCILRKTDPELVDDAITMYESKKKDSQERDALTQKRKVIQQEINASAGDDKAKIQEARNISERIGWLNTIIASLEASLLRCLHEIPNLTHPSVAERDVVVKTVGQMPDFDFKPKTHLELGESLDILDVKKAAEITGSKFYYLKNEGVLLEQALTHYALSLLRQRGFDIFSTPDLARANIVEEMGFVARGDSSQIYNVQDTDQCLVGTAEITLGSLHRDEIVTKLPYRYGGLSHCFRKEAGGMGKETKGLYRVHQFTKVEMFVFCKPEDSEKMLADLVAIQEAIYDSLNLPYRVVNIGYTDLGNPAYQKFDLEAWMPGLDKWGEITSASNCTDYQSRRLLTRYQSGMYAHTLNATAVAVPRTIIAILENYQRKDGRVEVPQILRPLVGKEFIG
jgi:seryl-tRNA synthetase